MNGMSDFEKWLAEEIREMRKEVKGNSDDIKKVDKKLAVQKVKSGLLGTAGGAGVLGIRELIELFKSSLGGGS